MKSQEPMDERYDDSLSKIPGEIWRTLRHVKLETCGILVARLVKVFSIPATIVCLACGQFLFAGGAAAISAVAHFTHMKLAEQATRKLDRSDLALCPSHNSANLTGQDPH